MKKVSLGKIIESTVEDKYTYRFVRDQKKPNLGEYYKTFESIRAGQHSSTYDVVGKRDYTVVDKLVKKC
ncbi:unknown [Orgyia pseudotsugata multiple nucleopolyhedrovirus]|uniref:Uncharacterized 8.0 kDa protein n=1 Tax=Orgyia pseudotsugata multicapsid polyhedrosis virus TaxID=262177 RepID=Y055_NPVOP|nr:hypothetical protein OpmnVgp059 [Orgyia pseudotsugata multiple nucleopolyhedrovirus]O10313.1 RecName: Full=Uncharacterized 8.0 kDa protein [Orgyia pseudotsugata multiple nucleopolyhedrovirus]pir/T10328/ hypothetical protein 59 - Orgyia pseudotsugata nuclear polyhedrosis virus [Orgyia pseudotsugata single capsid nuclopolyhedrovirus]AKR14182.1 hypothetical protein [Dasychira pudibunda nucleopolyhedrovirus]AAC59058.1 unknown [Orgyia pseudotsugata multiple nucleopolyhedrovirus]WHM28402.1 hypoth